MRLSTLARKVNKTPTQLIVFLNEQGIEITNGLYSKLENEVVQIVMDKYMPEQDSEPIPTLKPEVSVENTDIAPEEPATITPKPSAVEEASIQEKAPEIHEAVMEEIPIIEEADPIIEKVQLTENVKSEGPKSGTVEDLETNPSEDIDIIKVKKIKLEGIKVVGKINLPKKQIKETKTSEIKDEKLLEETPKKKSVRNKKKPTNKRGKSREPLTLEEKRKLEESNKRRERQKKAREEKRRKQKYYQENIQPKVASKVVKNKKKKKSSSQNDSQETITPHKNPIKRLWAWLNGKYDQY